MVRIKPLIVFFYPTVFPDFRLGAGRTRRRLVDYCALAALCRRTQRHPAAGAAANLFGSDQQLMAEVGEQRRLPLTIDEIPEKLRLAFLAAEDDRFYQHPGIDWRGTSRAVWLYGRSLGRGRVPGGSTITQQVAPRFFSVHRIFGNPQGCVKCCFALKIEPRNEQRRNFRVVSEQGVSRPPGLRCWRGGASVLRKKTVDELAIEEMAMLAALPKAPSRDNPISGPRQAMVRRDWGAGSDCCHWTISMPRGACPGPRPTEPGPLFTVRYGELDASWVSEMARQDIVDRLGAEDGLLRRISCLYHH